jgi:hypothetical protein
MLTKMVMRMKLKDSTSSRAIPTSADMQTMQTSSPADRLISYTYFQSHRIAIPQPHNASSTALSSVTSSATASELPMSPPHSTFPPRINHTTTQRHKTRRTLENTNKCLVTREPHSPT